MHTLRHHDWREPRAARGVASCPPGVLAVGAVSVSAILLGPVAQSRAFPPPFRCAIPAGPIGVGALLRSQESGNDSYRRLGGSSTPHSTWLADSPQRSVPRKTA